MSDKAKELLEEAVEEYQSGDGATRLGSHVDAIIDILHLAHDNESLRAEQKSPKGSDWVIEMQHIIDQAHAGWVEETERAERSEVDNIPLKDLPMWIGHDWEFESNRLRLEQRLKDKDGTD